MVSKRVVKWAGSTAHGAFLALSCLACGRTGLEAPDETVLASVDASVHADADAEADADAIADAISDTLADDVPDVGSDVDVDALGDGLVCDGAECGGDFCPCKVSADCCKGSCVDGVCSVLVACGASTCASPSQYCVQFLGGFRPFDSDADVPLGAPYCAAMPAACAEDWTCTCVMAHFEGCGSFLGSTPYCAVRDGGIVVTCMAP